MDASKTFTYFIKAQTGDLERGFQKSGTAAKGLGRDFDVLKRKELDVREATLKVEQAQRSAARATERFGKDSLQAAQAQVRLERAQQNAARQTQTTTRSTSLLGSSMKRAAGAALGLAAGFSAIHTAKNAAETTEQLGLATLKLHKNFGLSVKSASEFAAVMKARGIDAKQGAQAFKTLSTNIVGLENGSKGAIQTFKLLGLSQKDLKGKDFAEQLALVSDGLKSIPGGAERAAAAGKLLGRGWQVLTPLLGGGSAAMQRQLELADRYGATLGGKTVKDVEKMIQAQREQRLAMLGIQVSLGSALIPLFTKASTTFSRFVLGFREGTGEGGKFRDTLRKIWDGARPTLETIRDLGKKVGDFANKHPVVYKLAGAMVAVGLAVKGIAFASKITGLSTFLRVAKAGAAKFIGYWATAGTAAGAATGDNLASAGKKSLPGAVTSMRGSLRAAGGKMAAAVAAGMIVAIPVAFAGFLSAVGNYLKKKIDPKGNSDKFGGGGNAPNAWDALKSLIGKAAGGPVSGGTPGRDSVPALLMPGEHVLTAKEVQAAGGHGAIFNMRRALGGGGQSTDGRFAAGGAVGGTWAWARAFAKRYGLTVTSSYRTPAQNRAVGGVEGSYHTRGSAANPQAFDFVPPSQAAAAAARREGAREVLIHNAGSGLHLHVGGPPMSGAANARVTVRGRGSWFGGPRDRMDSGKTAGNVSTSVPGCAIRPGDHYESGRPYLGGVWRITAPNGKSANIRQTDIGPNQSTGRRIDITYSALPLLGYTEGSFPTDGTFTATYLGKSASTSRNAPARSGGFRQTGSSFDAARRRSNTDRGIRANVNASRRLREAARYDTALTLAGTTPGVADDSAAASAGYNYWDTKVRQYAYGLTHGDKRVTGEMLADAVSKREGFAGANPLIASDVGGALSGGASGASADDSSVKELLAALVRQGEEMKQRAALVGQLEHGVLAQAITGVVTGQIGGSAFLSMQTPGSTGQFARY